MMEKLNELGIKLRRYTDGSQKVLCPQCSHTRKNKHERCLSVTINGNSFAFLCHHCGFKNMMTDGKNPVISKYQERTTKRAKRYW